jgi:hypothetical protein
MKYHVRQYLKVALWVGGEIVLGALLYVAYAVMPVTSLIVIATGAAGVLAYDVVAGRLSESRINILGLSTSIGTIISVIFWRSTHGKVAGRLVLVGASLMALLIIIDRRNAE